MQRGLANSGEGGIIEASYDDIIEKRGKLSNDIVRKWYKNHCDNIPKLIDESKTLEERARQACELRNKYRFQARELMSDQKKRYLLDEKEPIRPFEILLAEKMESKGLSYEEALEDVLKTASRTREKINKKYGVE